MVGFSTILPTDNSAGVTPGRIEGGAFGVTPDGVMPGHASWPAAEWSIHTDDVNSEQRDEAHCLAVAAEGGMSATGLLQSPVPVIRPSCWCLPGRWPGSGRGRIPALLCSLVSRRRCRVTGPAG